MVLESARAVLIRYQRDGSSRRGSGLQVGGQFVLTADHCADGSGHVVVVEGVEYPAKLHIRSGDDAVDVAVLFAPELADLSFLRCALIDRDVDAHLKESRASGFPRWKKDPLATADSEQKYVRASVEGSVPTAEGRTAYQSRVELGSFKITDPAVRGRPVQPGAVDESVWAGFSGAGVVTAEDILIGVIRSHTLSEGDQTLTVTPLEAINVLPPPVAAKIWAALGVAVPGSLPRLPSRDNVLADQTARLLKKVQEMSDAGLSEAARVAVEVEIASTHLRAIISSERLEFHYQTFRGRG